MYFMHGFGAGWMGLLWIVLVGGLIALLVTNTSRRQRYFDSPDSAMRILKERYARGEISRDEFEEKAKAIRRS